MRSTIITKFGAFRRPNHDSPFELVERAPGVVADENVSKVSAHYTRTVAQDETAAEPKLLAKSVER